MTPTGLPWKNPRSILPYGCGTALLGRLMEKNEASFPTVMPGETFPQTYMPAAQTKALMKNADACPSTPTHTTSRAWDTES